jgi:hypothetical protein
MTTPTGTGGERCAACGGAIAGGREACQRLFEHYNGLAHSEIGYAGAHRLLVDAYCMQHLDPYCLSAKSYAAHLVGLCWGVAHGGGPEGYAVIPRWLDGAPPVEKPPLLADLGALTLVDVATATDPAGHRSLVRAWADAVWRAYAPQHDLAERWLARALAVGPSRRRSSPSRPFR